MLNNHSKSTTNINNKQSHNVRSSKKSPEMDDIIPDKINTTSRINTTRKVSEHNNKNNSRINYDDGNNSNNHSFQREINDKYDHQQTNTSDRGRY